MNLDSLNDAINRAFESASINAVPVAEHIIADNATIEVETYNGPSNAGFRVICKLTIPEANFTITRVKDSGHQLGTERDWPSEGIEAAAQAHVARCIQAGADFVNRSGFDADRKVILLNKLLKAKEDGTVADFPKLTALYAWMETVQAMAVSGQTLFPKAPHSFEEVIKE